MARSLWTPSKKTEARIKSLVLKNVTNAEEMNADVRPNEKIG